MRVSRTPDCRLIPYHDPALKYDGAAALQKQIVRFVGGLRGERQTAVSEAQILAWFRSTDPQFVKAQLSEVCGDGRVRIVRRSLSSTRRHNGAYRYVLATASA